MHASRNNVGKISLASGTCAIGCHGNNYNHEENGTYHDKEIVVPRGKVVTTADNDVLIEVENHFPAKLGRADASGFDFGMHVVLVECEVASG